jgi:plastocyanin
MTRGASGTGNALRPSLGLSLVVALVAASALEGRPGAPVSQQPGGPGDLVGTIAVAGPPGRPVPQGGSVVWIPGISVGSAAAPAERAMVSRDKRFDPHVLAVPREATVSFPNADPIYHNVFSLSPGNAFDLGLYRKGAARSVVFRNPGLVRVYCNIHPDMTAYVVVVDGSAYAVTDADGAYRIGAVPPGRHTVRVWNEIGGETSAMIDFAAGRPAKWDPSLDGTRYRVLPHANKHGKAYPPATRDVDRY